MKRALTLTCLALLAAGGSAWARPSIAVLGLEVADPGGTPTPADTQVAKDLTEGLRARAKAGTGAYSLAPGSEKELIDLKLLNNCDSAAPSCMAVIGQNLGADFLMYGKIEKEKTGKAYMVVINLLDVKKKFVEHSSNDLIPLAQASGPSLSSWAKNIYGKLTGQQSSGLLVVKLSNADRGTILIDGDAKGNITNGVGQVSGLDEGKYKLAVESEGFRRFEQDITVRAGETQNIPVKLEKAEGGTDIGPGVGVGPGGGGPIGGGGIDVGNGNGHPGWRKVFYSSVAVGVIGGAVWVYGWHTVNDATDRVHALGGYSTDMTKCDKANPVCTAAIKHENDRGDLGHSLTLGGGIATGVAGAVAIVALYEGFIAKKGNSAEHAMGHRQHRDRFVVTPILSPSGGGATLQLTW
jgi:hypothetical protein